MIWSHTFSFTAWRQSKKRKEYDLENKTQLTQNKLADTKMRQQHESCRVSSVNPSTNRILIHSDKGRTLDTSAHEFLFSGQISLST